MTGRMKIIAVVVLVALAAGSLIVWRVTERRADVQAAADAYIFAMPLVLTDVTREETFKHPAALKAEPNRMYNIPILADATFRTVIRPNVDTLYSLAWISLGDEPVVLSMPANNGRYNGVQFMDAWTNVFAAPGIRTLGNEAQQFLVVGPEFKGQVPAGMEKIVSPTNMVWAIARVHARDEADLPDAQRFQYKIDLRPLSKLNDKSFGPIFPDPRGRGAKRAEPMAIVQHMSAETFYKRFVALARANPPAAADAPFVKSVLAPLGLDPAAPTPWEAMPQARKAALQAGIDAVWKVLTDRAAVEKVRTPSGWAGFEAVDKIGSYGTNYRVRAGVAAFGLAANLPEDAIYLNATVDGNGADLLGGKSYRMRFGPGDLPPVKGFWSVTLYDREGYLIDHPLRRYAIKQFDKLQYGADGSLEILIQPDDPGPARRANWLPSPATGKFALSLRAYWPEEKLLRKRWSPPAVMPRSNR